ncbi:hypothetical protein F4819DRAFT_472064 [Hypoxylon fuscum]|nr:hypothetical protein F4819DRAFT_472064 [Hypoxylon fuscum]
MAHQGQLTDGLIQTKIECLSSSSVYVRCPNCKEIHCHDFPDEYSDEQYSFHCAQDNHGVYRFQFPCSKTEAKKRIYEKRVPYIATEETAEETAEEIPTGDFQLHDIKRDIKSRLKWTDSTEIVYEDEETGKLPSGIAFKTIQQVVVPAMCEGMVNYVRHYLESSSETKIFLYGVEAWRVEPHDGFVRSDDDNGHDIYGPRSSKQERIETSGKTALHMAACEIYPEMVEILLEKGAKPNVFDINGRTPLAEAALWGRLENVKLLLKYGAKKQLKCVRGDRKRVLAVDFARSFTRNKDECDDRSGGSYQYDKENMPQDREMIVDLLLEDVPDKKHRDSDCLGGFAFTRWPMDGNLLTLVAYFNLPKKWKTIGVLYRGNQFTTVAAMSGWSHQADHGVNIQVAGKPWTDEVYRLSKCVGHKLEPRDDRDQGISGQYHACHAACHAEKQLIAFFVHNLSLPYEMESEDLDLSSLSINEGRDEEYEQRSEELSSRGRTGPDISLKKATIMVCLPICNDCKKFVKRVNSVLGLEIEVFHRCLETGCGSCRN